MGGGEDPKAKERRERARLTARKEQTRTAQTQAAAMTQDFQAAFGRPSLFTMRKALTR